MQIIDETEEEYGVILTKKEMGALAIIIGETPDYDGKSSNESMFAEHLHSIWVGLKDTPEREEYSSKYTVDINENIKCLVIVERK